MLTDEQFKEVMTVVGNIEHQLERIADTLQGSAHMENAKEATQIDRIAFCIEEMNETIEDINKTGLMIGSTAEASLNVNIENPSLSVGVEGDIGVYNWQGNSIKTDTSV